MTSPRAVVVEADGGSRGNPGPAAYGAVVRDAETGEVIAETGETIGVATNNVAEYQGLIAGLRLVAEFAPGARVEVLMDSKLVVEQMSGRWKIKHPAMRPLAAEASALAPAGTTYRWIPRERNQHADRLVNQALDGEPTLAVPDVAPAAVAPAGEAPVAGKAPARGWARAGGRPTTLVLVRHGATEHTAHKRFSGGRRGEDPVLVEEGRAQIRAVADWLAGSTSDATAVVTSPLRRAVESAEILGSVLGLPVEVEDGVIEMEFGAWEGLTFGEIWQRAPEELTAWIADPEAPAGGDGDSFGTAGRRVLEGRDRIVARREGETVLVVSHVTPIKLLVADALGAPIEAIHRMELAAASVTVLSYFEDPQGRRAGSMRLYNGGPAMVGL